VNGAELAALLVYPALPAEFDAHRPSYESYLRQCLAAQVLAACGRERLLSIDVDSGPQPAQRIAERVSRDGHDLVYKLADTAAGDHGLPAVDMDLLRKCPCRVWLSHAPVGTTLPKVIAVAVEPDGDGGGALARQLLRVAADLAIQCDATLAIVSCWDYAFEDFLRHSTFARLPADRIITLLATAEATHRRALDTAIAGAALSGGFRVAHLRGPADRLLPVWAAQHGVELMIMGTVARSGLPALVIGNTAEDVFRQLECSLLVVKPPAPAAAAGNG
jgi:universal stress protein E